MPPFRTVDLLCSSYLCSERRFKSTQDHSFLHAPRQLPGGSAIFGHVYKKCSRLLGCIFYGIVDYSIMSRLVVGSGFWSFGRVSFRTPSL